MKLSPAKINERLAEVAGLKDCYTCEHAHRGCAWADECTPDGCSGFKRVDFYNSLDAQAKWLWPVLMSEFMIEIQWQPDIGNVEVYSEWLKKACEGTKNKWSCEVSCWKEEDSEDGRHGYVFNANPANASALAILEAIDGEEVEVVG